MNTETAKEIANERHKFLEKFLREFSDEWDGKKQIFNLVNQDGELMYHLIYQS